MAFAAHLVTYKIVVEPRLSKWVRGSSALCQFVCIDRVVVGLTCARSRTPCSVSRLRVERQTSCERRSVGGDDAVWFVCLMSRYSVFTIASTRCLCATSDRLAMTIMKRYPAEYRAYLSNDFHDALPSIVAASMRRRVPAFKRGAPVRGAEPSVVIVSLNMPASADSTLDARLRGDVPNTMYDVKHGVHWLRHRALDRDGVPPGATGSRVRGGCSEVEWVWGCCDLSWALGAFLCIRSEEQTPSLPQLQHPSALQHALFTHPCSPGPHGDSCSRFPTDRCVRHLRCA